MTVTEARMPPGREARFRGRPAPPKQRLWRRTATPWLFLAPALLLFLFFKFIPMFDAVRMSFQDVQPFLGDTYAGGANYAEIIDSPDFRAAVWHTVALAIAQTAGSILLGLALALLLEGQTRVLWFIRSAIFLPVVTAMAVVAEVWRVMYYPAGDGALNSVLSVLGLGPSEFLNSPDTSLASIAAVGIWRGAPYDMMIFLAGLASVDRTLYEASAVDGASRFRRVWHVTLPGLRPVFAILLTLAAIRGLRVFTEVFLLTNGGPDGSTEVLLTLTYKLGLERNELGVAAGRHRPVVHGAAAPDGHDAAATTGGPMRNQTALGLHEARGPWARVLRFTLYTVLFATFAGPLLALMVGAFTPTVDPTQFTLVPDRLSLDNLERAVDRNVLGYLLNSFVVVGGGLILQVLVSVFAGYALARKRFRGSATVLVLFLTTMMLPEEVLAVPLAVLLADLPVLHISLVGSLAGMIVPVAAWGFSILVMTEFMKEIPRELEESAQLDGAGELRIFWQVILPLCRPALGVIGIFGFVMIWDQYMLPLLVATDPDQYTLSLALRTLRSDDQVGIGVLLAGAFLAMLPSTLAFLALQRSFVRGLTSGAVKG